MKITNHYVDTVDLNAKFDDLADILKNIVNPDFLD